VPMPQQAPLLDKEILKAMNVVRWDVNYAGVPTSFTHKYWHIIDKKDKEDHYDIIVDYFRLPRQDDAHHTYEAVISTLEQAIGVYEARLKQAKRDIFNPVVWVARIIRLPISALEHAGMIGNEKAQEMVLGGYAKFIKVLMGIILALVAVKLGVSVPWKETVMKILDFVIK
jgi:hypothetical protein